MWENQFQMEFMPWMVFWEDQDAGLLWCCGRRGLLKTGPITESETGQGWM